MTEIASQTPDAEPEIVHPVTESILPDAKPEDKAPDEIVKIKAEYEGRLKAAEDKAAEVEKQAKAAQKKMYEVLEERAKSKPTESAPMPRKTFDQYMGELDKQFEDDPKAAFKKLATDIAYDRDLQTQQYQEAVKQAEERAFQRALALDPERQKTAKAVEELSKERPDLDVLSWEQKVEFVNLRMAANGPPKKETVTIDYRREQDLASDVGGRSRMNSRGEKLAAWVNDPDVQREAVKSGFTSKKEILDWSDPVKAAQMAKRKAM